MESIDSKNQPSNPSPLDLMEREVEAQIRELPQFTSVLRQDNKGHPDPSKMVFTGSGDSYAASLFAHYLSNGTATAGDPYELFLAPLICKNKTVYITSVSGRTRANVRLAKLLKSIARNRVAITANLTSPLVKECDQVIQLPYTSPGAITPGTLAFSLSLLAVASRIRRLPDIPNLAKLEARAKAWASLTNMRSKKFLFVGTGMGYALASYGAFKIHEVLGVQADYEHTEQVGHSKLFSLNKMNEVICYASSHDRRTSELSQRLGKAGLDSQLLTSREKDPILAGLEYAFSSQHLALNLGRRARLEQVAFLADRKLLRLSNSLIY